MTRTRIFIAVATIVLACAGTAWAFQALPSGGQVNDDPAAGINKTVDVSGDDPTNADVVGGALTAGKVAVPWAVFRQQETSGARTTRSSRARLRAALGRRGAPARSAAARAPPDVQRLAQLRPGRRTARRRRSTSREPAGRCRGRRGTRTRPAPGFGNENIFASRFDNTGDANQGKWIFAGQGRGTGGGSVPVPSLNIHTNQDAENPSVAGGSAIDPTKPGPWVTWQETTDLPVNGKDQIFVVRPIGPGAANCDGVTPAGVAEGGHVPAIGGFCWQQTGIPRVGPGRRRPEPERRPDARRHRAGHRVHRRQRRRAVGGLVRDGRPAQRAARQRDGVRRQGRQRRRSPRMAASTGSRSAASCSGDARHQRHQRFRRVRRIGGERGAVLAEQEPGHGRRGPAGGGRNDEPGQRHGALGRLGRGGLGVEQIFVSRLVGTGAEAHFELANGGAPISTGSGDSTRPDITFSGNTPYVSWREDVGGASRRRSSATSSTRRTPRSCSTRAACR